MKNIFLGVWVIVFAITGCRSNDDGVQQIDQVLNIYIDSAGQDMLNAKISGSYQNLVLNDINGFTDIAPVSGPVQSDRDTIRYIEYVAGARRILIDSSNTDAKIYQSKISLIFTKKTSDTTTSTFNDVLTLNYVMKPDVFQIQNAWYNQKLVFTKAEGLPNIIKVSK